ncbi:MAG: PQQ-binding-like beta-propeller repeat protein [Parvibaculaceae bacterium]
MQTAPSFFQQAAQMRALTLAPVLAALLLAGCDTVSDFFVGSGDEDILPGTRISVLALERELRPNIETVDTRIILPRPEDTPVWPGAGGFSHHAMHHLVIGPSPEPVWSADIGAGTNLRNRVFAEPVIGDKIIYTMDANGVVSAFETQNGRRLWRRPTAPDRELGGFLDPLINIGGFFGHAPYFLGGALAVAQGRLFVSTGAAEILALDARDGTELWRTRVDTPVRAAPVFNGGRVYAITVDNQVIALAADDGRELWTYSGAAQATILLQGTAPAVDGGVVVAAFTNGELLALRTDTGAVLWSDSVVTVRRTEAAASLPDIAARPVIDRGRVFAVGQSGLLVAIDLRTGRRAWELPVPGIHQPWVAGDFLFAVTMDGEMVCVDARSGRILWVTQLPRFEDEDDSNPEDRIVWAGPALASDRLILVSSDARALSISPYTGAVLGQIELDGGVTLPPVFAEETMYVLADNGELTAYR